MEIEKLEEIILSEPVTDENYYQQIKLCQFCEDIIDDYKTILDIAVRCKKINKKEFQFLKKMKECHGELADRIIEYVVNNGYQVVKIH